MDPDPYLFSWAHLNINPTLIVTIVSIAAGCLFLTLSALVSAAEFAFFSLTQKDFQTLENSQKKSERRILKQLEKPEEIRITSLLVDTLFNVLAVISFLIFANNIFPEYSTLIFAIQIVAIVLILLLFGEITPQVIASKYALKTAQRTVQTLIILKGIFYPFVRLLAKTPYAPNIGSGGKNNTNYVSMSEISNVLDSNTPEEDKEMIEGIVKFGDTGVVEIMRSRSDMVDIEMTADCEKLIDLVIKTGYTRIPVYSENKDNIKGLIYSKDLLPYLRKNQDFEWQTLIRPAYFVPESKKIDDLLREFQENKALFAIVIDEYGGTSGLVTMEDILEEIVGDISDEYDEDENLFIKVDDHTYIFEGKILLNDFYKIAEINEETFEDIDEEVETLAGLMLEIKGEIPAKKEMISYRNYHFEILSVDNRRIKKIKLKI